MPTVSNPAVRISSETFANAASDELLESPGIHSEGPQHETLHVYSGFDEL